MTTPQVLPSIDARSHVTQDQTNQTTQPPDSTSKAISAHKEESKPETPDEMRSPEVRADTTEKLSEIADQIEALKVDDTNPGTTQDGAAPSGEQQGPESEDVVDGSRVPASLEARTSPQPSVTEDSAVGTPGGTVPLPSAEADVEVRLLDPEEGGYYLTQVILEVYNRY